MDEQTRRKKDIKKKVFVMQKNLAAYRKAVAEKCALCGEPVGIHIDGGEASQKTFYNSTGGRIHAECYLQQLLAGFRSPTPAGYNRSSAYHGGAKAKSRSPEDTTRVWGAGSTACCPAALGGHSGYILAVACSPDSAVVASASSDIALIFREQLLVWQPDGAHGCGQGFGVQQRFSNAADGIER